MTHVLHVAPNATEEKRLRAFPPCEYQCIDSMPHLRKKGSDGGMVNRKDYRATFARRFSLLGQENKHILLIDEEAGRREAPMVAASMLSTEAYEPCDSAVIHIQRLRALSRNGGQATHDLVSDNTFEHATSERSARLALLHGVIWLYKKVY